jgi:hypothetical protein
VLAGSPEATVLAGSPEATVASRPAGCVVSLRSAYTTVAAGHVVDADEHRCSIGQGAHDTQQSDSNRPLIRRTGPGLGSQQRDIEGAALRTRQSGERCLRHSR